MKKHISFLLILTMILSMLCIVPAAADGDEKQSGDFSYRIKRNGTAVITGYRSPSLRFDDELLSITIPAFIDGYPVTEIGESAFADLASDVDPFYYLTSIRIYLPDGITAIDNFAFYGLSITELNIPDSVEEIGYGIVGWYESRFQLGGLDISLNISQNHPCFALIDGILYNKQRKEIIACCRRDLSNLVIPEGIVSIGDYAFVGNSIDASLQFPASLKEIGSHSFENCNFSYGDYTFTNVQSVGAFAFFNWYSSSMYPATFHFPSLKEIGESAFSSTSTTAGRYIEIHIDLGEAPITTIGDSAFACSAPYYSTCRIIFESINLQSVVTIGKFNGSLGACFKDLSDFPPHLTSIPDGLNPSPNSLPNTVKRIESRAYITDSYNDKRTDFYLPSSLEYIAEDAFATGSTFIVELDSYALRWCKENGFGYKINGEKQDLDWLNN